MYCEDNTSHLYVSISCDTVQSSATSSETGNAATTPPANSLLLSSGAGEQSAATSHINEGCQHTKFPTFLREREEWQGKAANVIVVMVLVHFTTKNHSMKRPLPASHRWEANRPVQAETAKVATQTLSQMNARFHRLENNVGAVFDGRPKLLSRILSRISTSTRSTTRNPDSRSEETYRRDSCSLNTTSALEFESHFDVAAQREGFQQTRDYLQRSLNASN